MLFSCNAPSLGTGVSSQTEEGPVLIPLSCSSSRPRGETSGQREKCHPLLPMEMPWGAEKPRTSNCLAREPRRAQGSWRAGRAQPKTPEAAAPSLAWGGFPLTSPEVFKDHLGCRTVGKTPGPSRRKGLRGPEKEARLALALHRPSPRLWAGPLCRLVLLTHTLLVVRVSVWAVVKEVPLLFRKRQPPCSPSQLCCQPRGREGGRGWPHRMCSWTEHPALAA